MKRGPSMHDESLSEPPSTLSESAGASGLLACPFCGSPIGKPFENLADNPDDEDGPPIKVWTILHNCTVTKNHIWCQGDTEVDCISCWNTRAAPVQAEPVAWRWRYRTSSIWNVSDCDVTSATMCAPEFIIERLYASPPTPVSGEAPIELMAKALANAFHGDEGEWQGFKSKAEIVNATMTRLLYATPVSAGLGKQRRQIESSKTTDDLPRRPASEAK